MKRKDWIAPRGKIWVCRVCGKTAKYKAGETENDMHGWDESCFLNCELFDIDKIERDSTTKRVIRIKLMGNKPNGKGLGIT